MKCGFKKSLSRRVFLQQVGALALSYSFFPEQLFATERSYLWHENSRPLMGTYCSIAVFLDEKEKAQELIDSCFRFIEKQIAELSFFEKTSTTSLLNAERILPRALVSKSFLELLELSSMAQAFSARTFSPLNGGLNSLWREARERALLPSKREIGQELQRSIDSRVDFLPDSIALRGEGLLEFGGVGKGFIAKLAASYLSSQGLQYGRVACSGDIAFLGNSTWDVDIIHPRKDRLLGSFKISGAKAVATSGDYVFFKEIHGERIHHLIDLKTGEPAKYLQSATVIADDAGFADALATSIFMLSPQQALNFVRGSKGVDAILVDRDGEIHQTRRLLT